MALPYPTQVKFNQLYGCYFIRHEIRIPSQNQSCLIQCVQSWHFLSWTVFFCYMSRVTNLANGNTWLYTVNFKCNSTGVIDSEYWIDILNLAGDICLHWFGFNSPHFWMLRIPCLENSLWYVFGEKLCFNMVFGPLGYILQTYSHIVYIKLSALRGVIFVVKFSTDQTRA